MGDREGARKTFEALGSLLRHRLAESTTPTDRTPLLRELADLHTRHLGQGKGAIPFLEELHRTHPGDLSVANRLCGLLLENGRAVDAIPLLLARIARTADPLDARADRLELASIYLSTEGGTDRARSLYRTLLEADPADADALEALIAVELRDGNWAAAVDGLAYKIDLVHESERPILYRTMAEILQRHLGDPERAANCLAQAMVLEPTNPDIMQALSEAYDALGRQRDLLDLLRHRAKSTDDSKVRVLLYERMIDLLEGPLQHAAAAEEVRGELEQEQRAARERALDDRALSSPTEELTGTDILLDDP